MQKLLDQFIKCASLDNAKKLVRYIDKHPMSLCFLSEDHAGILRNAQQMVER